MRLWWSWLVAMALSVGCVAAPTAQQTRDDWWRLLGWSGQDCSREAIAPDQSGVSRYRLADGRDLIQVQCFLGAYQGDSLFYLGSADDYAGPLVFPQFESPDEGVLEPYRSALLSGTVQVDRQHGRLQVLRRYRGIGDCGQLLTYALDSPEPRLVEFRSRECGDDGDYMPPESWPVRPLSGLPR